MHDFRQKLYQHKPRITRKPTTNRIKMRHTFRIKAHDVKKRLLFFKVRTKQGAATIRRFATLKGFIPDRITK